MINRIGKEATSLFKSNISFSNDFTGSLSSSNCPSTYLDFPLPPNPEGNELQTVWGELRFICLKGCKDLLYIADKS